MDNMLHRESSVPSSLGNGNASSEEQLATAMQNGSYMESRNCKRLRVAAVSESLPKLGLVYKRLRTRRNQNQKPSPLKLSKKMKGEYGEGSRRKNSEQDIDDPDVGLPLVPPNGGSNTSWDRARNKVKETLRVFNVTCREILQAEEANPTTKAGGKFRVDYKATQSLRSKGQYPKIDTSVIGSVPGVEVGDVFQYRIELNILGIHKPCQGGIDYTKYKNGKHNVATSIVSSGCYGDDFGNTDAVIYTGQGGNVLKGTKKGQTDLEPKNQELVRGNLALKNSIAKKNAVRVIRGKKKTDETENYVYDGLYQVEDYWTVLGPHGKNVYKFRLRRRPGQRELSWISLKKSKKSKLRDVRYNVDLSGGQERFPVFAVNDLNDEKPPPFIYTAKMIYPDWCRPTLPKGCGCKKRCAESKNCACVAKNGKDLPYNYNGAIVKSKSVVYECGPHCGCPPSCYLQVTQQGIKIPLEIFKTESRGWGVRSLKSISSGSFICEYVGELLEDKEAERLTGAGEDEYLFDIGKKGEVSLFAINAAKKGNIGRFVNHSCSPNLYAQQVLYDHEDRRLPHVALFAIDNIPPLQELTYDYNYTLGGVCDSDGNIKKKTCSCGSLECTGRLY